MITPSWPCLHDRSLLWLQMVLTDLKMALGADRPCAAEDHAGIPATGNLLVDAPEVFPTWTGTIASACSKAEHTCGVSPAASACSKMPTTASSPASWLKNLAGVFHRNVNLQQS
jgi:hypothetical protein